MALRLCLLLGMAAAIVSATLFVLPAAFSLTTPQRASVERASTLASTTAEFLAPSVASNDRTAGSWSFFGVALLVAGASAVAARSTAKARTGSHNCRPATFVGVSSEPVLGQYVRDELVACSAELQEAGAPTVEDMDATIEWMEDLKKKLVGGAATALFAMSSMTGSAGAFPIFAQQLYEEPEDQSFKIACANCHLQEKTTSSRSPHEVLPDTIFKVQVDVLAKYDIFKQPSPTGDMVEMNAGAIVIMPPGYTLAPKERLPKALKKEMKGLAWSPYSAAKPNILVAGPVPGKVYGRMVLPILAPTPDNKKIFFGKGVFKVGGNRGRGQFYPDGKMSNINAFTATDPGTVKAIDTKAAPDGGEMKVVTISKSDGSDYQVDVLPGATMIKAVGDSVAKGEALTTNPNVGGFGQNEHDIVLQDPTRVYFWIGTSFSLFLSQLAFTLKKKQFEKVQLAEGF